MKRSLVQICQEPFRIFFPGRVTWNRGADTSIRAFPEWVWNCPSPPNSHDGRLELVRSDREWTEFSYSFHGKASPQSCNARPL